MRLYSTRESFARGELSLLAIVETIIALSALALLILWTWSYWPLLLTSTFGWALLLRTDESTRLAIRLFIPCYQKLSISYYYYDQSRNLVERLYQRLEAKIRWSVRPFRWVVAHVFIWLFLSIVSVLFLID